ncbi:hypothetical protein EYF80_031069 [Liparis tanakae]|uniref:Uncharacterized protein n=1 Tax=Liparis tanakae TaxID=230148 RepID=A0A4Z2H1P9_9TELE|nr:hypothetical protein EYF80_031069 [Liparis tanakae]
MESRQTDSECEEGTTAIRSQTEARPGLRGVTSRFFLSELQNSPPPFPFPFPHPDHHHHRRRRRPLRDPRKVLRCFIMQIITQNAAEKTPSPHLDAQPSQSPPAVLCVPADRPRQTL